MFSNEAYSPLSAHDTDYNTTTPDCEYIYLQDTINKSAVFIKYPKIQKLTSTFHKSKEFFITWLCMYRCLEGEAIQMFNRIFSLSLSFQLSKYQKLTANKHTQCKYIQLHLSSIHWSVVIYKYLWTYLRSFHLIKCK